MRSGMKLRIVILCIAILLGCEVFGFRYILAAEASEQTSLYDLTWDAEHPEKTLRLQDAATDIYGSVYGRALTGMATNVDNYGDYELNREYDVFSGTIIRNAGTNPAVDLKDPYRTDICISVYGDGVLLYRCESVNLEGNEIQEFGIGVSGVDTLRVVVNGMRYISLCNAVLEKRSSPQMSETDNIIWSTVTQEYNDTTYTTMDIGDCGDEEYYRDKALLGFAVGSEFICYDDRIYYMEKQDDFMNTTSLYSANLDGTDACLIDRYCQWPSDMVMADGKLYYSRCDDYPLPSEVMCYDPKTDVITNVCEGTLLCSGYGALYVKGNSGVQRIDPGANEVIQISGEMAQVYVTPNEIVLKLPENDGAGGLVYPVYDMKTGAIRLVVVPDEYAGSMYFSAPCSIAGDYLFTYGNGEVLQYLVTDGTLIDRLAADSEDAFRFGQTLKYNQQYAGIFNEESWSVFSEELNSWILPVYAADVRQAVYEVIQAEYSAVAEFGLTMPQSAEELVIRNCIVMCALEDFAYIACETEPYKRNAVEGEKLEFQNVWIVKVKGDRSCDVIGSTYWQ